MKLKIQIKQLLTQTNKNKENVITFASRESENGKAAPENCI